MDHPHLAFVAGDKMMAENEGRFIAFKDARLYLSF